MNKSYHVTPNKDGSWNVKGSGDQQASSKYEIQSEAIEQATKIAKKNNSELFIHDKDGKIRERNSYGNDPYPPKE